MYMYPQRVNITLQGLDRRALTVGAIPSPHYQTGALHWRHFSSHGFTVCKKHSGKADQSTLPSGGSEYAQLFSVAISWGNKINFILYANMMGFSPDSHNYPLPCINKLKTTMQEQLTTSKSHHKGM